MGEVVHVGLNEAEARELGSLRMVRAIFGVPLRADLERRYHHLLARGTVADRWRAESA